MQQLADDEAERRAQSSSPTETPRDRGKPFQGMSSAERYMPQTVQSTTLHRSALKPRKKPVAPAARAPTACITCQLEAHNSPMMLRMKGTMPPSNGGTYLPGNAYNPEARIVGAAATEDEEMPPYAGPPASEETMAQRPTRKGP